MQKYWKLLSPNPEFRYLIVRHPMAMTDNYGSYDYGSNTMYVSGGQLRPYYFKDSSVYMLNYARIGFYMGATLLKTMDMKGGHFKPGYNYPINWRGVYAMERTKEIHDCLQEGKNMSNARKAVMMTNAFTPGFRFFRTMALERAYPKPEYRVDKFPEFSMADLYFFSVVQTMCADKKHQKELINEAVRNDKYFQEHHCTKGEKMFKPTRKLCYLWHSTRRNY
ncbi:uncharacterized protein ISCGN_008527 [Ixodes scapularis]